MKRWMVSCVLCCSLMAAAGAAFSDVSEADWYADAVDFVAGREMMEGVGSDRFDPGGRLTRGMVAATLYRLEGSPAVTGESFSDVAAGAWYADAAAWARGAGVAAGYADGTFGPDDSVQREQLAVFLWRYARYRGMEEGEGVLGQFADAADVSDWALEGVKHAVGTGLMGDTGGGRFLPAGEATRAQLAVILQRLLLPVQG